jgi:hypothetical protein
VIIPALEQNQKAKKDHKGEIICLVCGVIEEHPTHRSDLWYACWCVDPERCLDCGVCPTCFPDVGGE